VSAQTRPTHDEAPSPERGPQRFQQAAGDIEATRSRWSGVGALLVLLLLVVGVPVALMLLGGGLELPSSLPSREDLTGSIGVEQIVTLLTWIVWLAWLQFTICVLVELRSAVRGIGMPARVPLAGPSQRAARTLVAAVLLLVTAAGQANAVTTATIEHVTSSHVAAVASAVPGAVAQAHEAPAQEHAAEGKQVYHLGDIELDEEEGRELVGKKVAVVTPPEGRYHDNLWDIAERHMGDGRRYHDIFELNKGRDQPDGQELTLARLIQPGWLLVMPEDAAGVERVTVTAVAPVVDATPAPPSSPVQGPAVPDAGASAAQAVEAREVSDAQSLAGSGLLAAGLLAAVVALRRRRRTPQPGQDATEMEVALRVGADPARASRLDSALRGLAALRVAAGQELPAVYAARIDDAELTVFLSPADSTAPAPWRATDDGRQWHLAADAAVPSGRGVAAPYPGLVSLGRSPEEADVLIDLEAAQGTISIVGDDAVARELATAIAAELVTNRWSDSLRVTGVDLPDALAEVGGERYRSVPDVEGALPALTSRQTDVLGSNILAGRVRGAGGTPEYLVAGSTPSPESARLIAELAADGGRAPWGAVVVGDVPGARWRIEVDADGAAQVGVLGLSVTANRLSARRVAALGELLVPEPADEPVGGVDVEGHLERPDLPPTNRALGSADLWAAPVRVLVLGDPRVEADGPIDDDRRALCTELVVHLALHPEGVHPTVLGAAVWPRGVTAAVVEATVARAREWLGKDAHGAPHLRHTMDGNLVLGARALLDWDVVRSLLAASRAAATRDEERALLHEALDLVRGETLQDVPAGRYSWLARARLERDARSLLVDAAHRLAVLSLDGDDPSGAREAATSGLGVAPLDELLWRDLLRAVWLESGPSGVRSAAEELQQTLLDAGVRDVPAQTTALIEELAPSSEAGRATGA
jgi:hypothetical protein